MHYELWDADQSQSVDTGTLDDMIELRAKIISEDPEAESSLTILIHDDDYVAEVVL